MPTSSTSSILPGGAAPEVHWYEGQGHGAWGDTFNLHWAQVIAFFGRHLSDLA